MGARLAGSQKVWSIEALDVLVNGFLAGVGLYLLAKQFNVSSSSIDARLWKLAVGYNKSDLKYGESIPTTGVEARVGKLWTKRDQYLLDVWRDHGQKGGQNHITRLLRREWREIEKRINPQGQRKGFAFGPKKRHLKRSM